MSARIISLKDFFKLFPGNRMMDTLPLIKVELIVDINFETFGQVQFTDDNGRPWIKEFVGNSWSKEIYLRQHKEILFRVFVNNTFLQKGRKVTLIKKIDNEVVDQKDFQLSSDKLFEGWFRLG
ncbi:MAG: hypothetical protein RL337_2057 [Bacteroidota bacterium]